jgi:outer membrane biosynthesis protein TonB
MTAAPPSRTRFHKGAIFGVATAAHLLALFLIGRTPLAAPIALATITLDLVAAGDAVPETVTAQQDSTPSEPASPAAETPARPDEPLSVAQQPSPPETPVETIPAPEVMPERIEPSKAKPPPAIRQFQPKQQQAESRSKRVGSREARAQRPGMSRAAYRRAGDQANPGAPLLSGGRPGEWRERARRRHVHHRGLGARRQRFGHAFVGLGEPRRRRARHRARREPAAAARRRLHGGDEHQFQFRAMKTRKRAFATGHKI